MPHREIGEPESGGPGRVQQARVHNRTEIRPLLPAGLLPVPVGETTPSGLRERGLLVSVGNPLTVVPSRAYRGTSGEESSPRRTSRRPRMAVLMSAQLPGGTKEMIDG